jgi:predicted transcriptional regulator of viral defense system
LFLFIAIFVNKQKHLFQYFRSQFKDFIVFNLRDISASFPEFDPRNLVNWQKKGYLIKLRNGFYMFSETTVDETVLYIIANRIYTPSYISLETALNHHGLIPESVHQIQSVTSLKTNSFENQKGSFRYYSIKPSLYFGYQLINENGKCFRMASREKALLDFLYLRSDINDRESIESVRWNPDVIEQLDQEVIRNYLLLFKSATLSRKIKILFKYIYA